MITFERKNKQTQFDGYDETYHYSGTYQADENGYLTQITSQVQYINGMVLGMFTVNCEAYHTDVESYSDIFKKMLEVSTQLNAEYELNK